MTAHCTSCVTFDVGRHRLWLRPDTGRKLNQWMDPLFPGHSVFSEACQMATCTFASSCASFENSRSVLNLNIWHVRPKKFQPFYIFCSRSGFYCVQKPSVGFITRIFVQIHFDYFGGHCWHVGREILARDCDKSWVIIPFQSILLNLIFISEYK